MGTWATCRMQSSCHSNSKIAYITQSDECFGRPSALQLSFVSQYRRGRCSVGGMTHSTPETRLAPGSPTVCSALRRCTGAVTGALALTLLEASVQTGSVKNSPAAEQPIVTLLSWKMLVLYYCRDDRAVLLSDILMLPRDLISIEFRYSCELPASSQNKPNRVYDA
jgi:hypothetical protein